MKRPLKVTVSGKENMSPGEFALVVYGMILMALDNCPSIDKKQFFIKLIENIKLGIHFSPSSDKTRKDE